jgi:hypothetical protein
MRQKLAVKVRSRVVKLCDATYQRRFKMILYIYQWHLGFSLNWNANESSPSLQSRWNLMRHDSLLPGGGAVSERGYIDDLSGCNEEPVSVWGENLRCKQIDAGPVNTA